MTENWYIVLGLEFFPHPISDETIIAERIDEKRRFWTRNEGDINRGADYRKYGQMIEDIKKDMIGEHNIRAELIKQACELVYSLIDPKLKMIRKAEISEEIIEKIAAKVQKEAKCDISTEVVRSRVLALGIKISSSFGGDYQAIYDKYYRTKPQNADKYNGMSPMLRSFHVDNLYEFLNIGLDIKNPQNLPCDALRLRAREKKDKEFYKHDSISGSGSKLCGLCEECFRDESTKQVYDNYLEFNKRREILENVKSSYEIADELTAEAYFVFLEKLTELFKNRKEAESLLIAFCKIEKIVIAPLYLRQGSELSTIKVCRCGSINDISGGRKICGSCGLELELICPQCGKVNDANIKVCKCGFPFENIDKALALFEFSESALQIMDFDLAESQLREAERYWPSSPNIVKLKQRIRERKQWIGTAVEELKMACKGKRYYEALSLLKKLRSFASHYSNPEIEGEISSAILESEKYKKIALSSQREEEIIESCIKAHEICKDIPGIKDILSKYPPKAPTELVVEVNPKNRVNALSWTKSASSGLLYYYVVRKEGAIPLHVEDGTLIGRVSSCGIIDNKVSTGVEYFYSVFAERGGVYSKALYHENVVSNFFEISNLVLTAGDGFLKLEWAEISDKAFVEIERRDADGARTRLACNSRSSFVDRNLENATTYHYKVFLTYMLGSKSISTEGAFISGTPIKLPMPVGRLALHFKHDNLYELEWDGPEEIAFFYTKKKPDLVKGDIVSLSLLESSMASLIVNRTGRNQATFSLEEEELIYILAVSIKNKTAVIGPYTSVVKTAALTIKNVSLVNGKIFIATNRPESAAGFMVLYRNDAYPADISDPKSTKIYIPIKQFEYDGGLVIEALHPYNYYFLIFTELRLNGESLYSGASYHLFSNLPKQEISYSIKVNKSLFHGHTIDIVFEGSEKTLLLPDIDIISARDRIPMFKHTGELFYQISGQEVKGSFELRLPLEKGIPRDLYIKPFLRDEALSSKYVLKIRPGSDNKIT